MSWKPSSACPLGWGGWWLQTAGVGYWWSCCECLSEACPNNLIPKGRVESQRMGGAAVTMKKWTPPPQAPLGHNSPIPLFQQCLKSWQQWRSKRWQRWVNPLNTNTPSLLFPLLQGGAYLLWNACVTDGVAYQAQLCFEGRGRRERTQETEIWNRVNISALHPDRKLFLEPGKKWV